MEQVKEGFVCHVELKSNHMFSPPGGVCFGWGLVSSVSVFSQYYLSILSVFSQYSLSVLSVFSQCSLSVLSVFSAFQAIRRTTDTSERTRLVYNGRRGDGQGEGGCV